VSSWFAVTKQRAALRVSSLGLVIGRAPTCDLVLAEPAVSRRHVLLQFGLRGKLDIVPLPGARTTVNGTVITAPVAARDGDVLAFPGGESVSLVLRESELGATATSAWLLSVSGRRIGLRRTDLTVGGGDDDIMVESWPSAAVTLTWDDDMPYATPHVAGVARAGTTLERDVSVALAAGDELAYGGRTISMLLDTSDPAPTVRGDVRVTEIALEMLAAGGIVTVATTTGEHRVLLAERRFALVCALFAPPPPYAVGEFIPDEVIIERVWPRGSSADRGDLNQLVFRVRSDFKAAGLAGLELIERYAKGGAARATVDASTAIRVRT
jgi:hypothetical protein